LNKDVRRDALAALKKGQIAIVSHQDAVRSYNDIYAASLNGMFKGMAIDEPQELASKSVTGNMSASVRKLTRLETVKNRIALTATPARDNIVEAFDLANWASHKAKSLGPRSRFQRIYGGYGSGTNAQDATLQQMIYHEISPYTSGGKITQPNFKVNRNDVIVKKTNIQNNNMKAIEKNADKFVDEHKAKFIAEIKDNPEELRKWQKKGSGWEKEAGIKAGKKAKDILMKLHDNNLEGIHDKMAWKDNPKISEGVKNILGSPDKKHVIFLDNQSQRTAIFNGLIESGLTENQIENIASTTMSSRISGAKMGERAKNFKNNKDVRVIFIDKQSASGYNLQTGDQLHVLGTPSDAANYLQAQGRLARMPRTGDVDVKTYKYSDVPFEDQKWSRIDTQMKILRATAPAMFVGGK
jgi:hypothetical protein